MSHRTVKRVYSEILYSFFSEEKELLGESRDKALQRVGDLSVTTQDAQQKYAFTK